MTASFERIKDRFGTADLPKLPVSRRPAGQPVQLDHQWDSQRQTCHEADENAGPAMGVESQPLLLSRPADKWHEVFKSAIQVTGKTMIRVSGLPFTDVPAGIDGRKIAMFPNVVLHTCRIYGSNAPNEGHDPTLVLNPAHDMEHLQGA